MNFWMMPDNAAQTLDIIQPFIDSFKEQNPGVEVNIRVVNRHNFWQEIFTLRTRLSQEDCPDLIAFPHYWTQLLSEMEVIENLTLLDKTLRVDHALDPLKPHCYRLGSADIYSYPWWMDVSALHYRQDHLKLITSDPQKLLSTWDGLLEACRLLKEHFEGAEGYYPMQNSDWRGSLSGRGVLPCVWSRGAFLFNEEDGSTGFGEPAFEQGVEDFTQLALKHYMPILRERSSLGTLSSGRASLVITRRQGLAMFEGKNDDFSVSTLPVPRSGAVYANYLSSVNLAVVKGRCGGGEALKLLKWLASPDNQIKYAAATEVFPALDASFASFLLSSPARLSSYTGIIANSRTLPNHITTGAVMEIVAQVMSTAASAAVTGKYSEALLRAELKKAKQEADAIMRLYGE